LSVGVDSSKLSEVLPHAERFPHTRFSWAVASIFAAAARWLSWVWLLLIGVVVLNVTMRYLFGEGRVEFEEVQWHLYSIGFLIGLSTCMSTDDHVRVDIFHERLSLNARAWIELYGLMLLFFPFVVSVIIFSVPFVGYSFEIGEVSDAPGGLPFRWVIKSILPLAAILLVITGVSRMTRVMAFLFGWPAERARDRGDRVGQ
jgi:TRAP-type mannitol/chloroaromatic compound transport system permease small subunit